MGIKHMQGVSAKIEFLDKKNNTIRNANCKYSVGGICNNEFSKRYQKECKSRLNCDYSTPVDFETRKGNKIVSKRNTSIHARSSVIKKNYFTKLDCISLRYNEQLYKADLKYDLERDILSIKINYNKGKRYVSVHNIPLKRSIQTFNSKIKFTIYLADIISSLRRGHMDKAADYILLHHNKDIVEEVYFNNGKEIESKIKSLVIYMVYMIVDAVTKTTKISENIKSIHKFKRGE